MRGLACTWAVYINILLTMSLSQLRPTNDTLHAKIHQAVEAAEHVETETYIHTYTRNILFSFSSKKIALKLTTLV